MKSDDLAAFTRDKAEVLVNFSASTLGTFGWPPLLLAEQIFAAFAEAQADKLVCVQCSDPSAANISPKLKSVPSFVVFQYGKGSRVWEGSLTLAGLQQLIEEVESPLPCVGQIDDGSAQQPCQIGIAISEFAKKPSGGGWR